MKSIDWRSQEGFDNNDVRLELSNLISRNTHPESEEEGILHGIQKDIDLIILTDDGQYIMFRDQIGYEWIMLPGPARPFEVRVLYISPPQFISAVMIADKKLRDCNKIRGALNNSFSDHDYNEID